MTLSPNLICQVPRAIRPGVSGAGRTIGRGVAVKSSGLWFTTAYFGGAQVKTLHPATEPFYGGLLLLRGLLATAN